MKMSNSIAAPLRRHLAALQDQARRLSLRERALVAMAIVVICSIAIYYVAGPVTTAFRQQALDIAKARMDATSLPAVARRYLEIKSRRATIENRFKQVEFREDTALSYLEKLIREKAQIPPKEFNIRQGEARDFGKEYQQTPFTLKFSTQNLAALVEFLKELVEGAKPLILSRLDISRRRGSNRLDIEMDASAIKHK